MRKAIGNHSGSSICTTLCSQTLAEGRDDYRTFNKADLGSERYAHYRATITELIADEYGDARLFAIKDPRICRFVPLYEEVLDALDVAPLYVLPFRDPWSVSKSLNARNGMTPCFAAMLWLRHVLDAEFNTRRKPRAIVSFERLLSDWRSVVDDVGKRLELSWPRSPQDATVDVEAFLDCNLCHHWPNGNPLAESADFEALVKIAYRELQAIEHDENNVSAAASLDDVRSEFDAATSLFGDALFREMQIRKARHDGSLDLLRRSIAHSDARIATLNARVNFLVARLAQSDAKAISRKPPLAKIHALIGRHLAGPYRSLRRAITQADQHTNPRQESPAAANVSADDRNSVQFGATAGTRSSFSYGDDYLSELRRVITTYADDAARRLLEWGMGNSTQFFIENRSALGLVALYSLDHAPNYFAELLETLPKWENFHPFCVDLMGPKASDRDPEPNFATFPGSLNIKFDIVYIDGRRRMECALASAQFCHSRTIVVLHDYRRMRYQGVHLLFDIVEDGTQFRVMKLKPQLLALRNAE